jgi:hypothetical protein
MKLIRRTVFLDFEYYNTKEDQVTPVCVAYKEPEGGKDWISRSFWLLDDSQKEQFYEVVDHWKEKNFLLSSYSVQAECRAFLALGIDPRQFKWIDLYLEYRMLLNNNDAFSLGQQLIDGKVKTLKKLPPKFLRVESESSGGKAQYSLSAAVFKLLGKKIDTEHKSKMRDLIISGGPFYSQQKESILYYCLSDCLYLDQLLQKMVGNTLKSLLPEHRKTLLQEITGRANYAICTAEMECKGYPIDFYATKNFSASVASILYAVAKEISLLFPEIQAFDFNKAGTRFKRKEAPIRNWIVSQGLDKNWTLTDTGRLSLSLEAFQQVFNFRHEYPQDNFGAQIVRFLKIKQSLNGFAPARKAQQKTFWDSVGKDNRVRPFLGIFGSQTSRSQPSSTGFIPLKASWMRCLILPKPGKALVTIDYSQQEFLIAAMLSGDRNMLAAYASGDVYLHTAKLARAVPQNATKSSHPAERDKFKSTVLGIQYQMGSKGLAEKLSKDTGTPVNESEAQRLIDLYYDSYADYESWIAENYRTYKQQRYLRLEDGWIMWGDNPNRRSIGNFPIQGTGGCVLRKAVTNCRLGNLEVVYTLHDAITVECDSYNTLETINKLAECMLQGFRSSMPLENRHKVDIRLDANVWSPDFTDKPIFETQLCGKVEGVERYVDKRSFREYLRFKPYFFAKEELSEIMT